MTASDCSEGILSATTRDLRHIFHNSCFSERVIEIRDGEIVRNPPAIEKVNVTGGTEPVVNTVSGWRQFVSGFNEALTNKRRLSR